MRTVILFFVMLICVSSFCRARTVRGTVYDSFRLKPLRGVLVKAGISVQATTDAHGHYAISMPRGTNALVFGCPGYVQQTVNVHASDTLDVWLRSSYAATDSMAVPGYSTNTNDEYKMEERVELAPAFMGRVAGVSVSGNRKSKLSTNAAYKRFYSDVAVAAPQPNEESYQQVSENGFTNPMQVPLSTFAVDVDAASYSNFRRYINGGQLPPADAVRIEEMINYFHYQLPEPEKGAPVAIKTELSAAPWNPAHRLLRIALKAKTIERDKLPPSSLVFLIDVSGSMSDANKLPLVKSSMKLLVDQLRPVDKVAIVTYAGEVAIKLPATPGSEKIKIKEVIDALGSGGSTAGGAAIRLAYNVAREAFIKEGNNRIVLATDGDFNVGPSSDKDMLGIIEEERNSGVSISILGFGMGNLKDSKMELMADKGHGNYAYIDNITEATKSMVSEFGGTLFTVAKDVKLQIEFNPAIVQAYRLIGYENRLLNKEDFNDDKKLGGDMG